VKWSAGSNSVTGLLEDRREKGSTGDNQKVNYQQKKNYAS
jgi:hypothetical protein